MASSVSKLFVSLISLLQACEKAFWAKALAGKADDMDLIHGTHIVEGETHLPLESSDLHTHAVACLDPYTHTQWC